jgi:hypothetical protein
MTAVPAYNLAFDELKVALGYATIGVEGSAVPASDAVAKAMNIQAPKPAKKEAKKVNTYISQADQQP